MYISPGEYNTVVNRFFRNTGQNNRMDCCINLQTLLLLFKLTVCLAGEGCTGYFGKELEIRQCDYLCCGSYYDRYCCSSSLAIIVGSVIGGVVLIAIIVAIVLCCVQSYENRSSVHPHQTPVASIAYTPNPNYPIYAGLKPPPYANLPPSYSSLERSDLHPHEPTSSDT